MKRWWIACVVLGLTAGGGIVWWLWQHKPEPNVVSDGGSVPFGPSNTPSAEGGLAVRSSGAVPSGSVQGLSVGGAQATSAPAAENTSTHEPVVPTKDEFAKYEGMKNEPTAFFAELRAGAGAEVKIGSKAAVLYRGWLTDGTIFDDSYDKKTAFEFEMGAHKVIPGWEQGVFGMKVGGKRRLIIPPKSGYGASGQGPVPANAMLIFDVELVQVR